MSRSIRLSLAFLALPLAITFSSCGDGAGQGINVSGPGGNASGGANSTPTPTPTPASTPAPTATPGARSCTLPAMPNCSTGGCCSEGGGALFNSQINDAQADLERTRPEIFNGNGSLRVDELEYTDLLAKKLTALFGLCTEGGGNSTSKDEVGIKSDNGTSQNVDVIIGSSNTPYS
mgnify:CR=1 FL=1